MESKDILNLRNELHTALVKAVNTSKIVVQREKELSYLDGWRKGVESCGIVIDYQAVDLFYINQGVNRPMVCGVWIDWKPE